MLLLFWNGSGASTTTRYYEGLNLGSAQITTAVTETAQIVKAITGNKQIKKSLSWTYNDLEKHT